jgi:hypothetical protein
MELNRNPHFSLSAKRGLNRNHGCQETLQKPCFFNDFSSSTFLNPFWLPTSHTPLACKSTFYLHESTYFTTCLDCLLCSRLGKAAKTAQRCQGSVLLLLLLFALFLFSFCSPLWLPLWGPRAGDRHQNRPRWSPHCVSICVDFDLICDLEPDLEPISCRPGLDLGSLSRFGFDLAFDLGSIWGSWARSGTPVLDLELLGSIWGHWA